MTWIKLRQTFKQLSSKARNNESFTKEWETFSEIVRFMERSPPPALITIQHLLKNLEKNISKDKIKIFDHGCGSGFKSMYFAVQAMAAELSTGVLAILHTDGKNMSVLVTSLTSDYYKKATTKVNFVCLDGNKMLKAVEQAIETGEAQKCVMHSKGYDLHGVCVSEFQITWSLKQRRVVKK